MTTIKTLNIFNTHPGCGGGDIIDINASYGSGRDYRAGGGSLTGFSEGAGDSAGCEFIQPVKCYTEGTTHNKKGFTHGRGAGHGKGKNNGTH